jgi:hypothetical protein
MFARPLIHVLIRRYSGFEVPNLPALIRPLERYDYVVKDQPVGGDAPKDFIRLYEPPHAHGNRPAKWPAYIAKVGHQYYPAESITEQLMTVVGDALGIRMAKSKLVIADGQIRFLSRYFLRKDQSLDHGAQIVAGYLADEQFVKAVEAQGVERDIFTFQVLCEAIRTRFPANHAGILRDFVRMIGFDALVGNQDRHLYNWGVVSDARGPSVPRFSPIYDTARGLFWNTTEEGLAAYQRKESLERYIRKSTPLIGWDSTEARTPNHFDLVRHVVECKPEYVPVLRALGGPMALTNVGKQIDRKFGELLSVRRIGLIKECLARRFELYAAAVAV